MALRLFGDLNFGDATFGGEALNRRRRIRVDVYNASGVKLNYGAIGTALACSYSQQLDEIGSFSLEFPADDEKAGYLQVGYEVRIHREGEGLVFRGTIDLLSTNAQGDRQIVQVSGSSVARKLVWANTLLARQFNGATLATAVGSLLSGTGWAAGEQDVPVTTLLSRYDGVTIWKALANVAEIFGLHVREDPLNNQVDVGAFGDASGLTFQNVAVINPELAENPTLYPITAVTIDVDGSAIWNRIIFLGGGEGINQLTLRYSTRTAPYAIQNAIGPDGQTYYYLEDASSVAAYGARTKVIAVKEAVPLAQSPAGLAAAANALYDVGATWLARHKDALTEYGTQPLGLIHLDGLGTPRFELGQKVRLIHHGVTKDDTGTKRAWGTVDANLWLMGFQRTFSEDGGDEWQVTVSTVDRAREDEVYRVASALEDIDAMKVAVRPSTLDQPHILNRTSIQSPASTASNNANLRVKFDANVANLHRAGLTFYLRPLRSNTTAATGESAHQHFVLQAVAGGPNVPTSAPSATTTVVTGSAGTATVLTSPGTIGTDATNGGVVHTHPLVGSHLHALVGGSGDHYHKLDVDAGAHTHIAGANPTAVSTGGVTGTVPPAGGGQTDTSGSGNTGDVSAHTHAHSHSHSISGGGTASAITSLATGAVASSTHTHNIASFDLTYNIMGGGTDTFSVLASGIGISSSWATRQDALSAHAHALTYGIFVDPAPPDTPAVSIYINATDRTTALGGPWSVYDTAIDLDITQYLQQATGVTGQPLQQVNTIEFRSGSGAFDVEAICRTLITMWSLVPV